MTITPFIAIVDRAIVENISGRCNQWVSIGRSLTKLTSNPVQFVRGRKELSVVYFVYGSTYLTANTTETVCRKYDIPIATPKFVLVSAVNIATTIVKDKYLAKVFGNSSPGAIPWITYSLWCTRDALTILAAFVIPNIMAKMATDLGYNRKRSEVIAQFLSPILLQTISTPIHILGFDYYNKPESTVTQRFAMLKKEYVKSTAARMLRMTPAYGIGGVINLKLMQAFRKS